MARLSKSGEQIERASRRDPGQWQVVAHVAHECGCLDHKVIASGDEALLVEEWSDAGRFETFFDRTPSYRKAIDEAGFRGFPDDIKVWHAVHGEEGVELR